MSRRGLSSTKFFAVKLTGPFLLKTQRKFSKGGNDGSYFWSRRSVLSSEVKNMGAQVCARRVHILLPSPVHGTDMWGGGGFDTAKLREDALQQINL